MGSMFSANGGGGLSSGEKKLIRLVFWKRCWEEAMSEPATASYSAVRRSWLRDTSQVSLPVAAWLMMLAIIFWIRPSAFSYFGFTLLFKLATPLVFASLSQMLIIMLGDIDLSNGS